MQKIACLTSLNFHETAAVQENEQGEKEKHEPS